MTEPASSGYAAVNGLEMYYEVHGSGDPLVLLHGGFSSIDTSFGKVLPSLAKNRRVIAIEQQGHGHTADINRPLSQQQMAEDTASLLAQLEIDKADFFGYSMGGNIALILAMTHPELVRKVAVIGTNYNNDGLTPEAFEMTRNATGENMPAELRDDYREKASHPEDWPELVAKVKAQALAFEGFNPDALGKISAPVLVMIGDRDFHRVEHEVELFRLIPHANLAVLPASDHQALNFRSEWIIAMVQDFLELPMPKND